MRILVKDATTERKARAVLVRVGVDLGQIDFYRVPTDRSWTRDFCPLFVKSSADGDVAITNWKFNGWGKYPNHKKDDAVNDWLAKRLRRKQWTPTLGTGRGARRIVLEGGSIDVNGKGCLLTTEECLLSDGPQRNPGLTQTQVAAALGIKRTNFVGLLNELEKRTLAERRQVSGDKRSYALWLTPEGATLMRKLRPVLKAHESRMIAKVGEDGRDQLVALLHNIADAGSMGEPRNGTEIKGAKASRVPRPGSAET